jgi:hypothetical protein
VKQKGGGYFDVAWMGDADDNGTGDGWMGDESLFDFEGVDIFAACYLSALPFSNWWMTLEVKVERDVKRREEKHTPYDDVFEPTRNRAVSVDIY